MASRKVQVRVNGKPRNLLSFDEGNDGSVYVRLYAGGNYGMSPGNRVVQCKFSLHPSHQSKEYVTLKHTFELEDGGVKVAAVTDAVKSPNKFFHVFSHIFTDLEADLYSARPSDPNLYIGDFDPLECSFVIGLFVGNPESSFDVKSSEVAVDILKFQHFQVVLLSTSMGVGATPFGRTAVTFTIPPDLFIDPAGKASASQHMVGSPPAECLRDFETSRCELLANLLEDYIAIFDDEGVKADLREALASIPRVASVWL